MARIKTGAGGGKPLKTLRGFRVREAPRARKMPSQSQSQEAATDMSQVSQLPSSGSRAPAAAAPGSRKRPRADAPAAIANGPARRRRQAGDARQPRTQKPTSRRPRTTARAVGAAGKRGTVAQGTGAQPPQPLLAKARSDAKAWRKMTPESLAFIADEILLNSVPCVAAAVRVSSAPALNAADRSALSAAIAAAPAAHRDAVRSELLEVISRRVVVGGCAHAGLTPLASPQSEAQAARRIRPKAAPAGGGQVWNAADARGACRQGVEFVAFAGRHPPLGAPTLRPLRSRLIAWLPRPSCRCSTCTASARSSAGASRAGGSWRWGDRRLVSTDGADACPRRRAAARARSLLGSLESKASDLSRETAVVDEEPLRVSEAREGASSAARRPPSLPPCSRAS